MPDTVDRSALDGDLDQDYEIVARILSDRHVGRANAITKNDLTLEAGFVTATGKPDRRRTEIILEHYRDRFPLPVVGSGSGMYMSVDPADLNDEYRRRLEYIRSIARGWRSIRRKGMAVGLVWQGGRFSRPVRSEFLFDLPTPKTASPYRQ